MPLRINKRGSGEISRTSTLADFVPGPLEGEAAGTPQPNDLVIMNPFSLSAGCRAALWLLALFSLSSCATKSGYPDARREMDTHAEVPLGGDSTNRANGPVGTGPF